MVSAGLLYLFTLLSAGFVLGATNDIAQIGNRTIERTVNLRTHSLYAPYIDQDLQNRWWDFGADAYVNTNKHIKLTRDKPSEMGWLWSRLPITTQNYVIEVEFKISGAPSHLYGDGMAVWLTKGRAKPGPVFGNEDKFEGLGIFLDTYANSRHGYAFPRLVGMLGDGKTEYDLAHDGEKNSIGACSANFRQTNVATKLRIAVIKGGFLEVKLQYKAWDDWTTCFTITNATIPDSPFLGFSALTGSLSDDHDIITVNTFSAILSSEETPRTKHKLGAFMEPPKPPGWLGFLFKVGLFLAAIAGCLYGYKTYALRSAQNYHSYPRSPGIGGTGIGRSSYFDSFDSKRF